MLTTKQFATLLIMAILSGAFSSFLVIGIFSHDLAFAAISLLLLIGVFVAGIYAARSPKNRTSDTKIEGKISPEFEDK